MRWTASRSDARQKLMLTFNTPFFPLVLIASSVMAEGVDLHLNCRHVIHHDLCWNPSTLEQRSINVSNAQGVPYASNPASVASRRSVLSFVSTTASILIA